MACLDLKKFQNRNVMMTFRDGEATTGRITCLNDDCENLLVDVLSTNRPDRYPGPLACSYIVSASDITSINLVSDMDPMLNDDAPPPAKEYEAAA